MLHIDVASVVRWEKLSGKSFALIDFSCEDDMLQMMYCATSDLHGKYTSFKEYRAAMLNAPRVMKKALRELAQYHEYISQFKQSIKESADVKEDSAPELVADMAARLIVHGGMSASFVMFQMPVEDMGIYAKVMGEKIKQQAESDRLWCYLSILPHVSKKATRTRMRSPQTFYPFPWEEEDMAKQGLANIEKNKETFEKFMRGELLDPNKLTWKARG